MSALAPKCVGSEYFICVQDKEVVIQLSQEIFVDVNNTKSTAELFFDLVSN